ncbi:reverse transcriptase-like protein, partial [Acinetobacter baumannii]|uniref:reverse transcriptase-like protein n=1 Tax=Acinetobacter baumannii TaxID=470 RepID=UPI00331DABA2
NIDGLCRGNLGSCGGGGIIRDSLGNIKAAFSEKFDHETNNRAELSALTSCVRLCKDLGY